MNNYKSLVLFFMGLVLLQSCGSNNTPESNTQIGSALQASNIPIEGGSITKEIIIRSNQMNTQPARFFELVSGIVSPQAIAPSYNLAANDLILEAIRKNKEKNSAELYENSNNSKILRPENFINLGVSLGTGVSAAVLAPEIAVVSAASLVFGGDALKGFITTKNNNEYEEGIKKLNDRRDRDILLLSINEAKYAGDRFFEDLMVGSDPKIIKEKIFQYQNEIINKTNLSSKDMELFLKNSNDNFLFGLSLLIKDHQDVLMKDSDSVVKSLHKTNRLLNEMKVGMSQFALEQEAVLAEIRKNFTQSEQTIILNALFDKSNTSNKEILFSPEQLTFFKTHPEKLVVFKKFLKDDPTQLDALKHIVEMQEGAQLVYAYLQVTTQVANNLNVNPEIIRALNTGTSLANAGTSIASFMLTSNPLDALNSISALSGIFAKPKPDPRFTAIFENFKSLQSTLGKMQKQIEVLDRKLNNIDGGLKYVILQNQTMIDLNQEKNNEPLFDCDKVSIDLKKRTSDEGLNYLHLRDEFADSHQAETEKINRCLNYLSDTFKDSLKYKKVYFSNQVNPENRNEAPEVRDYNATVNKLNLTYSKLVEYQSDELKENELYFPKHLLSTNTIISNVRQLLANSFLFDLVTYNRQTHNWDLVNYNQIPETIKNNSKSEALLKDALKLVNVALVQQAIVDGSSMNDQLLKNFWLSTDNNCEEIQFNSITCIASLNPTLAANLISSSFDKLVTEKYYLAWKKLAANNPDWLNGKLGKNPIKVIWVGAGASPLFSGEVRSSIAGLVDGAYIKIGNGSELYSLPDASTLDKSTLSKSHRVKLLIDYKNALENEITERQISKTLGVAELNFYNNQKIKQTIQ
jgi:hypothetical protein